MEQIKNIGVTDVTVDDLPAMGDRLVLHVDPAMCDAEDTARVIVKAGREGKPVVLVIGNAGQGDLTRRLIEEIRNNDDVIRVTEPDWAPARRKRVGVLGGFGHLPMMMLAAATGPNWSMDTYGPDEDYFNYRLRIREEEVARGMRRPPKKAICSSRRRGRKFKG